MSLREQNDNKLKKNKKEVTIKTKRQKYTNDKSDLNDNKLKKRGKLTRSILIALNYVVIFI